MPRATLDTPLGPLTLASDGAALTAATFDPDRLGPEAEDIHGGADTVLDVASAQLAAYFAGEAVAFDVPLALGGTPFQERVWAALCAIPHGETLSYGALAARLGMPGAAQAVGAANGQNPAAVVVPCHRVVGADGALVGYAGGLERKRALLALESRQQDLF
ncbi:methylated-DNA--[protein]-cysteine S-methyltransferase [Rubrivirga sp. IMCC43871]|uniref:methylated-DNA--[protein]-cysteine S-methyltransferase n=1 Tax=Rubrivirga sp. IMCC43871 TaxID=3391575 RepID=UPI00398FB610